MRVDLELDCRALPRALVGGTSFVSDRVFVVDGGGTIA